jgi:predicted polyphosphate/ATP-dependent NAD kinase
MEVNALFRRRPILAHCRRGCSAMALVGFVINPIAGMGGRVGLKGTDEVDVEARRRGARPLAADRARGMLQNLKARLDHEAWWPALTWISCDGEMGADALREAGFVVERVLAVPERGRAASRRHTEAASAAFLAAGVDLVLFCGGDGTARDIAGVIDQRAPMLGIPSGVKMYSGVFGVSPTRTAEIVLRFLKGELRLVEAEVLDLDEVQYRAGKWVVRLYHSVLTPFEPTYTQLSKQLVFETRDEEAKAEIASYLAEIIGREPDKLFILGAGTTVAGVAQEMGLKKTLLGIDAVCGGKLVGVDVNEQDVLALLARYRQCAVVLSPIGAQGFVLGRGNLPLSPEAMRRVGISNMVVAATPAKLARTPLLRFDTGDADLDAQIIALHFLPVVVGYRRLRMVKIVI